MSGAESTERARALLERLADDPRFGCLPHDCNENLNPGMDDLPTWRVWTQRPTTPGQLRIEEQLENLVGPASSILHIGVGNSSLGKRLAPRVLKILGVTIADEERIFAAKLSIPNYNVILANKFTEQMDEIDGTFNFIADTNPGGFSCCLTHFARMMASYTGLLDRNGGLLLTDRQGLGWVCEGNHPGWSFNWNDWEKLADFLQLSARPITEFVYSMKRGSQGDNV